MSTEEQREKNRERVAAWRQAHPAETREMKAREYQRNREARLAQYREYRETHAAEIADRRKADRLADPEKYRRHYEARYAAHRDEILAAQRADPRRREYQAAYRARPRATATAYCWHANRRAEKHGAPGRLTADDVMAITGPCHYCGADPTGWDHVVPLAYGGANDVSNLVPACYSCNRKKGRRRPLA